VVNIYYELKLDYRYQKGIKSFCNQYINCLLFYWVSLILVIFMLF